ncbi:MAG TPA: lipid-A-disaccharide synthase N-terminal domain-containing protein [Myxococcota bacterium]|nr:lipid-A-disaccharide synthase N-terminal domain-containing protein [Myxococcota bacterium]
MTEMLETFFRWLMQTLSNPWTAIGIAGQVVFSLRFLVQWIASERAGRSVVPDVFWYLSILGSLVLLTYALHLRDLVFTLGQSFGFVVYARNLALRKRETA